MCKADLNVWWLIKRATSLFSSFPMLLLMILFGEIGFFFFIKSDLFSRLFCSWWYGIQCFFHGAGCSSTSGIRGTMFILMYVVSYVGGANLLRHAEGATWLAIVTVKRLTLRDGPLENLWEGGRSTKKIFAQGKIK